MTIRSLILLFTLPLFLALAGINGLLLYHQEKAALTQGLRDQALAAAVTTAAFVAERGDGTDKAALDKMALDRAAARIKGLQALVLMGPGGKAASLLSSAPPPDLGRYPVPRSAVILSDRGSITALAPAAPGRFVLARIDARPLAARIGALERAALLILALAGLTGTALALFVARRITRELRRNRAAIDAIRAGDAGAADQTFRIRETRDLADAVRLMEASGQAALAHGRRAMAAADRIRDETTSLATFRAAAFAPVAHPVGPLTVAARMAGDAPPGAFFALGAQEGRIGLVIGECAGDTPATALARALSARGFFEARIAEDALEPSLALGRSAFAVTALRWCEWRADAPLAAPALLMLLDGKDEDRAAAYTARLPKLDATTLLDDLEALLRPTGVMAALSAERGEG